jgi:arginine decarboxylase
MENLENFEKNEKNTLQKPVESWSIEDSDHLYNISRWGQGYFGINHKGHLIINPENFTNYSDENLRENTGTSKGVSIDFAEIIKEIKELNIQLPVVVRFHDILRSQVKKLNESFKKVIHDANYNGQYRGVYPIKVNQMREVVEEIVDAGEPYHFGIEAGSKTEIMAALALNTNKESLTILNGHKDEEFIQLGLLGRKLEREVIIVIEQFSELPLVLRLANEMKVQPMIGLRAKLSCKGTGKWCDSSGEKAKFGLSIPEILKAIHLLKGNEMIDCLKLFHFHMGSQVTDIRSLKDALREASRIYAKIVRQGVNLKYFDVGGGLAVDYDGSNSTFDSSMNYSLNEYVSDVVYILKETCDLEGVPHPDIVTECGRAITAHHSCVILNVFGSIDTANDNYPEAVLPHHHHLVKSMREIYDELNEKTLMASYNDAVQRKEECFNAFNLGIIDLEERSVMETLFWKICKKILKISKDHEFTPEGLKDLENVLVEQYLCNFSVFQSAADSWAIGQLLPVIPITRLNEKPTVSTTLVDITCDSDGKINRFIDFKDVKETLPLHRLVKGQDYYIGLFLTGAYQDIMGDNHNLFGRVTEVHVYSDSSDDSGFYIEEVIRGNSSKEILQTMQYSPAAMAQTIKKSIDQKVHQGVIKPRDGVKLTDFYEHCLESYTYLKN